jgi:glucosamine 6-phosphate synthetase-like amidotransferase/phosphosugar isomerase protein
MDFYCFGEKKPDKKTVTKMFSLLETRGRDALGFSFIRENNLIVHKDGIRSSELVKSDEWKKLVLPKVMILHTRMKTQGTEKNNANNHPLFNKDGLCLVHNGMIHNDREIFATKKRDAEVNSEAILAVLSAKHKGDKIKRVFDRLEGSFAFAVIDKNNPDTLIFVKKDNPLELYFDVKNEILYFCSERCIVQEALALKTLTIRGFTLGEGDYHHYTMENNH